MTDIQHCPNSTGSGFRVLFLCLLPDAGHVIPLMRIAEQLRSRAKVLFISPIEARPLLSEAAYSVKHIDAVRPKDFAASLAALSEAGKLRRALYLERWFEDRYFQPLQAAALSQLDSTLSLAKAFAPQLVITDDHLFPGAYKWIAERCHAPLVLHYSAGSCFSMLIDLPPALRQRTWSWMLEFSGRLVHAGALQVERLFRTSHYRTKRARLHSLQQHWKAQTQAAAAASLPTYRITTGVGLLEKRFLSDRVSAEDNVHCFPSQPPLVSSARHHDIQHWLNLKPGTPVVFACFGTMAPAQLEFGERIIDACRNLGVRLLWAGPRRPTRRPTTDPVHFRWENWVPQVEVLADPAVSTFITHAGAGSVQEAIWFGKPILAIPLLWDQPYNAWVSEQLGFGIALERKKVTAERVESALAQLLRTKNYGDRARELAAMMRESSNMQLMRFIEDLLRAPDCPPRLPTTGA